MYPLALDQVSLTKEIIKIISDITGYVFLYSKVGMYALGIGGKENKCCINQITFLFENQVIFEWLWNST